MVIRPSTGTGDELSARSPLLLDDPERGWRVVFGRADVFAVELVEGEARGRRHPIGAVAPGGALFGLRTQAAGLALLAIGRAGSARRATRRGESRRARAGVDRGALGRDARGRICLPADERASVAASSGAALRRHGGCDDCFAAERRLDRERLSAHSRRDAAVRRPSDRPRACSARRAARRDARAGRGCRPPSRREPVGGRGSRRSAQLCWTHSAARSPLLTTASSASLSRRRELGAGGDGARLHIARPGRRPARREPSPHPARIQSSRRAGPRGRRSAST